MKTLILVLLVGVGICAAGTLCSILISACTSPKSNPQVQHEDHANDANDPPTNNTPPHDDFHMEFKDDSDNYK